MLGKAGPDLVVLERMEKEIDKTVTCVCETCWNGWIMRLEDNASGVAAFDDRRASPPPLPPARRKMLARWAAKTAIVMECATRHVGSDPAFRLPSTFARSVCTPERRCSSGATTARCRSSRTSVICSAEWSTARSATSRRLRS